MKQGFALVNLMIGIVIAGAVFTTLMNAVRQFLLFDTTLSKHIATAQRIITIEEQLNLDIKQSCILHQALLNQKKDAKKEGEKNKKNKKIPLKECFFVQQSPLLISCVSTSQQPVKWPELQAKNESFFKRITYLLEPDPAHKNAYLLIRQESSSLTFQNEKINPDLLHKNMIASNLASCSVTIYYRSNKETKQKPSEQKEKPQQNTKPQYIQKTTTAWNDAFVYSQDKEKLVSRLPDLLVISYELYNHNYTETTQHTLAIPLSPETFYASTAPKSIAKVPVGKETQPEKTKPNTKKEEPKKPAGNEKNTTAFSFNPLSPLLGPLFGN